ncbi:MAG: iron-containing alcohol dehydrogenase [Spirochaetaceae bacterium]|nr:MAG: iron-containing alcohol dehydrogenase [Spirochaetaceae bacterium]
MWFFSCPTIVFGEDALEHLREIRGERALIVTDRNIVGLGYVEQVTSQLEKAGLPYRIFSGVEPDPTLQTVEEGARLARDYRPDWIIALGGGSVMDAAKAIWVLYARSDIRPDAISPTEILNLRQKARLIAIPTTSGTGSEVTWGIVLTDAKEHRKLALGSRETMPDIAILDISFVMNLPAQISGDTGMDVLVHSIEGYTSNWRSDFSDAPALSAVKLVFRYLSRAYADGSDREARTGMMHAATLASMSFGNAMAGLAHSMGHALGALFHVPHGRAVGLFLPYTMEYLAEAVAERYEDIGRSVGISDGSRMEIIRVLISQIRSLAGSVGQPLSVQDAGIEPATFEESLAALVDRAENEVTTVTVARVPDGTELQKLFRCAYAGETVDF